VNEPKTLADLFGQTIAHFPKYLTEWTVSLLIVILSETLVTTMAVFSILLAFLLHSVLVGFVAFFGVYTLSRIVYMIADAIRGGAVRLGDAVFHGLTPPRQMESPLPASFMDPAVQPTQILVPPGQ
jgi:hypothetical protein